MIRVVTEEEFARLAGQVAELQAKVESLAGGARLKARSYLTPVEVAKRHGVGWATVYEALRAGKLAAEARPHGGRVFYRIQPADAQRWYDAHVRAGTNQ